MPMSASTFRPYRCCASSVSARSFPTHHLNFAYDANNTLWTSAGGPQTPVIGWLNTKMFQETGDEQKSQGWAPFIVDTVGNGKRTDYVEPDQPVGISENMPVIRAGIRAPRLDPLLPRRPMCG
jgi:hypothetical protein